MKFIKIKGELLDRIGQSTVNKIAVVNDKDDLSLDDEVEFFNDANVAFGKAKINQIDIRRHGDISQDAQLKQFMVSDYDDAELTDNDHVKIISFDFQPFDEPKSISTNSDLATDSLKIFADGGSRGNPGPSASGYVILTEDDKLIKANGVYLGVTTNNQAEYKSIKFALQDALELGGQEIDVFMDSLLVVNQLNGKFKIKNQALLPIYLDVQELAARFESVKFTHVPREFNKLADAEVNKCLDDALGIT